MLYDFCIPVWCYDKDTFSPTELHRIETKGVDISWTSKTCRFKVKDTNLPLTLYGIYPDLPKINFPQLIPHCKSGRPGTHIIFGSTITPQLLKRAKLTGVGRDSNDPANLVRLYWAIDLDDLKEDSMLKELRESVIASAELVGVRLKKKEAVEESNKKKTVEERKDNKTMANLFGNIKVGKAGANYSITYFGTVAYKGKTYYKGTIYDAQGMTINFDMLYLVPSTEVKKGDIIDKDGKAYYVLETNAGVVKCINLEDGKEENLVPGGPFGMTMYSKLFNPMGQMEGENSFGNILMMQALCGNDGYGCGDNSMLLAMMMMQGGFKFPTFQMPTMAPTTTPTENKN